MSSGRRAYDIVRGYVNHGWDRVSGVDDQAEAELREAMEKPAPPVAPAAPKPPPMTVEVARRLLGVDENASAQAVERAYDDLMRAIDPNRFTADPQAAARAKELGSRLRMARELARASAKSDPIADRFSGLEIE